MKMMMLMLSLHHRLLRIVAAIATTASSLHNKNHSDRVDEITISITTAQKAIEEEEAAIWTSMITTVDQLHSKPALLPVGREEAKPITFMA
jgi:hypothetical protein